MTIVLNTSVSEHFISVFDEKGTLAWGVSCPDGQKASYWLPKVFQGLSDSEYWSSIRSLIVVDGPGSFTGLRVGFSLARAISYIKNINVLRLTSLEALALGAPTESGLIFATIDGQRNRVIYQIFERKGRLNIVSMGNPELENIETLAKKIPQESKLIGYISEFSHINSPLQAPHQSQKVTIKNLNFDEISQYLTHRKSIDWKSLSPNYYRKSSPEEKRKI